MVPSPDCPHCPGVTETINHYLLSCPAHRQHREKAILALGNRDWNTNNLLKGKPNPADPITNMTRDQRTATIYSQHQAFFQEISKEYTLSPYYLIANSSPYRM